MTFGTRLDILKIYLMDCMLKAPGAKTAIGDREREKDRERARTRGRERKGRDEKKKRKSNRERARKLAAPFGQYSISSSQEMTLASWSI